MDLAYGAETSVLTFLGLRLGGEEVIRMQNSPRRIFDRIRQPAWTYSPGAYGFYAYAKPELTLRTLENHLGRETMARVHADVSRALALSAPVQRRLLRRRHARSPAAT